MKKIILKHIVIFLITINIFFMLTIPVYGQSTPTTRNDNTLTLQTIVTIIIPLASGFGGTILGFFLSGKSARRQQENDLKKIRYLLNHDYSRLYYLTKTREIQAKKIAAELSDGSFLKQYIQNRQAMVPLIKDLLLIAKFVFWDTLVNNGSLIRLGPTEIQIIQSTHDAIVGAHDDNNRSWTELVTHLDIAVESTATPAIKIKIFQDNIDKYLPILYQGYSLLDNMFASVKTIDWLNLDLLLPDYSQKIVIDSKGSFHFE